MITEVLTDPGTLGRGYFREDGVRGLLEDHLDGTRDYGMQLWGLMMLELWHREAGGQTEPGGRAQPLDHRRPPPLSQYPPAGRDVGLASGTDHTRRNDQIL